MYHVQCVRSIRNMVHVVYVASWCIYCIFAISSGWRSCVPSVVSSGMLLRMTCTVYYSVQGYGLTRHVVIEWAFAGSGG